MHKPVWLRSNTWNFARTKILSLTKHEELKFRRQHKLPSLWVELSRDNSGSLLMALGLQKHLYLLKDTVIELPDESEYLLTASGANRLNRKKSIELIRIFDGQIKKWHPSEIWEAIAHGPVFDQLDLPTHRVGKERPRV